MAPNRSEIIKGEFVTDGETFVLRLAGTPFSGTGDTPGSAFDNLLQAKASAASLPQRLAELAREQEGERVRATVVRVSAAGIIIFGLFGGLLFATAAMLPRVAADVTDTTTRRLSHWVENMPPSTEERIAKLLQKASGLMRSPDGGCKPQAGSAADGQE